MAATLYDRMVQMLEEQKGKSDIVNRFEAFMLRNAKLILIDKRTMNFEACTAENKDILCEYLRTIDTQQFDFHWTNVNRGLDVSAKGHMSGAIYVSGCGLVR